VAAQDLDFGREKMVSQTDMESVEELAERISRIIPNIPAVSLGFWGAWFGRPYDAFHQIVKGEAEQGVLRLTFNEGEISSVWAPRGVTVNQSTFRILNGVRVRWEWFYYGRPQTPENLRFYYYVKINDSNRSIHEC
jgi:hypothetical protein